LRDLIDLTQSNNANPSINNQQSTINHQISNHQILNAPFMKPPPLLQPDEAYARWAEAYPPHAHNALMRTEEAVMSAKLDVLRPASALDLGTGTGRYLRRLTRLGASLVVGLDRSRAMIAQARAQAVPLVCADGSAMPFDAGRFDLVLASLVAGDIGDLGSWTREVARVLVSGGELLYSDFHPFWSERDWQRTFRTPDGRMWSVPYHPHALDDHRVALGASSFEVLDVVEPRVMETDGDPEVARFRTRWGDPPICVVIHARKR
jgi:malonyl-CoA O-methyltransferase